MTMVFVVKTQNILFSTSWASFFWINIVLFAVCALLVTRYWPTSIPEEKAFFAVILMSLPILVTNHIWHSAMSQLLAIVYVVMSLHFFQDNVRRKYSGNVILALCAGLFFFSKQNIGMPLIGASCAALLCVAFFKRETARPVLEFIAWNLAGVVGVSALFVATLHVPFGTLIHSLTCVLDRTKISEEQAKNLYASFTLLLSVSMGGFLLLFLATFRRRNGRSGVEYAILFCALFVSALPLLTDWDHKYNDVPLPIFSLLLLSDIRSPYAKYPAFLLVGVLLFEALLSGILRVRMHNIGVGAFWEDAPLTRVDEGYFTGLYAGPRFHELRNEMRAVLKDAGEEPRVFCGPRIEFCYMDNALRSPRFFPLWWHPGSSYPLSAEDGIIENFKANHFTVLFFVRRDRTRMPQAILSYIENTYTRVEGYDLMDVYRLP